MNITHRLAVLAATLGSLMSGIEAQCAPPTIIINGAECGGSVIGVTGSPTAGQTFNVTLTNLPAAGTPFMCLYSPGRVTTPLTPVWPSFCFLWLDPATIVLLSPPGAAVPVGVSTLNQPISLPAGFPCGTQMYFQYLTTGDYRASKVVNITTG